ADYPPEHALIAAEPYYSWLLRIKIVHTPLKLRMPLHSDCMARLLYRDGLLMAMMRIPLVVRKCRSAIRKNGVQPVNLHSRQGTWFAGVRGHGLHLSALCHRRSPVITPKYV